MKRVSLDELPIQPVSHNPEIGKRIMLDQHAAPGLTGFSQTVFSSGQVASGHVHEDMYEVFFVRRGRGMILVDEKQFELLPNECVLIEPGEFHELSNPYAEELVLFYFGIRNASEEVQS